MHTIETQEKVVTEGLCHIAINVNDMDRSLKFYTDMFAMEVLERTERYIQLRTKGAHDSFFLFKSDGFVDPRGCGMKQMHFGFRIDDKNFDKALEYIKKHNIKIHHNPSRQPGRFVYIEDPDGYVVQLEPGDCS